MAITWWVFFGIMWASAVTALIYGVRQGDWEHDDRAGYR